MLSVNRKILCKPYKDGLGVKQEIKRGIALIRQKNNLVELELIADANIDNQSLKAGDKVYIEEEKFASGSKYNTERQSEAIKEPFIIIDANDIVSISRKA